ncbi:uncharacterized protein MONBRDRAFT_28775 [Monosiga brevicollis MX1]|uniref:Sulfatase N-terminal domain-containing protein n=1 Tax=Monosiga brevicollis TaxID=81824 RepID=A9V957_MONBE|nr:uncharacterized protein MONBRDRAFT_28775 [Monosiga brevicollis MX1]EDQ86069.1 predicted protein [Monosiga brevicollis MX1]|eukprot:XP_001749263.1 hypothetical protein [Monosiga brevicollis MX1]
MSSLLWILAALVVVGLGRAEEGSPAASTDGERLLQSIGFKPLQSNALTGSRPNIVVLFVDDFGIGDVGIYNSKYNDTPNMDSLARRGMRFTDFHAMPLCGPSRATLLTGRLGLRNGITGNFSPLSLYGLPLNETTIAEVLQGDYLTAMAGKYHLGIQPDYNPVRRGFDRFLGLATSHDYGCTNTAFQAQPQVECPNYKFDTCSAYGNSHADPSSCHIGPNNPWKESVPLFGNYSIVEQPVNLWNLTERYVDFGIQAMHDAHTAHKPFFLYAAFNHMHVPITSHPDFDNSSTSNGQYEHGRVYGNALRELDHHIGRLITAIDDMGIRNNTIIFLTGDNGGSSFECQYGGSNWIYNGTWLRMHGGGGGTGKTTTWEGGHREAGIVSWPGKIAEGSISEALTGTIDYFPTIANLAGKSLPAHRYFDGLDMAPILLNASARGHTSMFHPSYGEGSPHFGAIETIRVGDYKAKYRISNTAGCKDWPDSQIGHGGTKYLPKPLIFNLRTDPSEARPLDENSMEYGTVLNAIGEAWAAFNHTVAMDNTTKANFAQDSTCTPEHCIKPCCSTSTPLCTCH